MARLEGKFSASGEEPLELAELLSFLGSAPEASLDEWRDALSRYLSGSEGWTDASQVLGGAFATSPTGSKEASKEDE